MSDDDEQMDPLTAFWMGIALGALTAFCLMFLIVSISKVAS